MTDIPPPVPPTPAATAASKPAWWKRKPVWIGAAVVLGLGAVGAATKKDDKNEDAGPATTEASAPPTATDAPDTIEAAVTTEAPTTTQATTTTEEATTTTESSIIESGVYQVGTEFPVGTYRVAGYWARLDATQEIIDNDLVDDCFSILIVDPTDSFIEINGAALPFAESVPVDPIAEGCTDGTFIVGYDIQPGQYKVLPGPNGSAYWARLDATLEIIDNDLSEGQLIVVIQDGDFAISISGTLQPMG